jgi:DNA polymerase-2
MKEQNIIVQPGEKVRYLVLNQKSSDKLKRYLSEEDAALLSRDIIPYDVSFYRKLWFDSYQEAWEYFAPPGFFKNLECSLLNMQPELPFA